MKLERWLLITLMSAQMGACSASDLFTGDFLDLPFGQPGLSVTDLDQETVQPVMNTLSLRFRSYAALREELPFEMLSTPGCLSDVSQDALSVSFILDVGCAIAGASGNVAVKQEDVSSGSTDVTRMEVEYMDVIIDDFKVHGREVILETDPDQNGSSKRELDLVQNQDVFRYDFRLGMPDEEQLAIDYVFNPSEGTLPVRLLLPPSSPGALGTVILMAMDGTVSCELRNVSDLSIAKGTCDNGLTFGLPGS